MYRPSKNFVRRFLSLPIIFLGLSLEALEISFAGTEKFLTVSIANNDQLRRKGLMHTDDLKQNTGMLFLWQTSGQRCMWMKDTSLSLSVAYLSGEGTIQEIYAMEPYSEESVCSVSPARMALEVKEGWFAENGIGVGNTIIFK
jgi:uncharacterized protein